MGGIGDYIHYRSVNYRDYGIHKKGEGDNDAGTVLNSSHAALRNLIKKNTIRSDLKGLENYYTNLLYSGGLNKTLGSNDEDGFNSLIEVLTDYMSQSVDKYAHVNDVERCLTSPTSSLLSKPKSSKNLKNINTYQIDLYLKALRQARDQATKLVERFEVPPNEISAVANNLKQISSNFSSALAQLKSEIIQNSTSYSNLYKKTGQRYLQTELDGDLRPLLDSLDEFLSLYSGYYGSTLAGPGWEALVTMGNIGFNNKLKEGTKQLIGKEGWSKYLQSIGHRGTAKEGVYVSNLSTDFVNISDLVSGMGGAWKVGAQEGRIDLSGGSTGTVDVVIENLGNEELNGIIANGESLNATLKNLSDVGGRYKIHIIDSTNLFIILGLFESDFINHYMNLLGSHPSQAGNFINTADFQTASYLIKLATAIRALSGARKGVSATSITDIIMINDRQKKRVLIRSTSDILNKTYEFNIDSRFSISGLPTGQGTKAWNNWVEYKTYNINTRKGDDGYLLARQRITNFLIQLQKKKISMSMSENALSDL